MVSSIVVTGCYNIGMNSSSKIKVNKILLSAKTDIPFIRYRFKSYGDQEYNYIKAMKTKFDKSVHLAEIDLNEDTLDTLEKLYDNIENIVKYIYIDLTDANVAMEKLDDSQLELLESLADMDIEIDRIMFRDKTTSLNLVSYKKIINPIMDILDLDEDYFGICSSPLSFGDYACLTAVKARELMSMYSDSIDVPIPTANHQCMNCCGCIRYMVVDQDIPAPLDTKLKENKSSTNSKDSTTNNENKTSKPRAKKSIIRVNQFSL